MVFISIIIPTISIIFYAGIQTQTLRELKRIVSDHEQRLRKGKL